MPSTEPSIVGHANAAANNIVANTITVIVARAGRRLVRTDLTITHTQAAATSTAAIPVAEP
jgi:hypothetical protein